MKTKYTFDGSIALPTHTRVTTTTGRHLRLRTDDTYTLAFPHGVESTPATLRAIVCERSLLRLSHSIDYNVRTKANLALGLRVQLSDHGTRKSAQVFAFDQLICDVNL